MAKIFTITNTLTGTVLPSATLTVGSINLIQGDTLGIVVNPIQVGTTAIVGTVQTQLQVSNDGTNWANQGAAIITTAGTNFALSYNQPQFHYAQLTVSGVTTGTLEIIAQVLQTYNVT
jgi:hypothetical protein